jgi:ACR3 family arsenite transporter
VTTTAATEEQAVLARLSLLDRFLPVWILLAMGLGLGLGRLVPNLNGVTSGQTLAGVVGPLIDVPVLVGLVYVTLWARKRFYLTGDSAR